MALETGFRGIDTANQRKHYDEAGVGQAIVGAIRDGLLVREDLFVQTKFTFESGQDHRLPYDRSVPITTQVRQSVESSLLHLQVSYLDSLLLHGPSQRTGLVQSDWDAWRAMETFYDQGVARSVGISNVSLSQLESLVDKARVRPSWVQNRCFAVDGWDRNIRAFCRENAITYQGFSLLTANSQFLSRPAILAIEARNQCSVAQVVFRFAIEIGILPLTGTTNGEHMRVDLDALDLQLTADEVQKVENIASESG